MYYADPADEGEPSRFSLTRTIILITLSLILFSCQKHNRKYVLSRLFAWETAKEPRPVRLPAAPAKPAKKKKRIYLTFDDGPNKGTQNVLDIVQQEEVPVTFFIVGEHVFASVGQKQTWDSLLMAKNIELCNHSYTHALHNHYDRYYENPDTVVNDMRRTKDQLLPDNYVVRAPGRNCWRVDSLQFTDIRKSKAAIDSLQSAGFVVFGWDLEWHYDPKTLENKNSAEEMLSQIDSVFNKGRLKVRDNLVLLAHDQVYGKSADSAQLRELIRRLKLKDEYEFALVGSYPGIGKAANDTARLIP